MLRSMQAVFSDGGTGDSSFAAMTVRPGVPVSSPQKEAMQTKQQVS